MRKLMKQIDRFCYNHPKFGIPNIMLYIVIGTGFVWLLTLMDRSNSILGWLVLEPGLVLKGQIWRLVTFIFVPNSFSMWLLLFLYFYYWIGSTLERQWGTPRFSIFLLSGVVLTVIFDFVVYFTAGPVASLQLMAIGTHYIYMSMFFSFATLFPDMQVLFMFILPLKVKWVALIDVAYFIYMVAVLPFPVDLAPVVAVLNYFIFFGDEILHLLSGGIPRQNKATVNFNREKAKMKYEAKEKAYNHKCAVCGRTDTEYPNLEFRYCSRCAGYHCFCADHINSHVHFTE